MEGGLRRASCTLAGKAQQHVHQPILTNDAPPEDQQGEGILGQQTATQVVMHIAGRGSLDYCDWWRNQAVGPDSASLFDVKLIGDASSPQLFTSLAHNDVLYLSMKALFLQQMGLQ